MGPGLRGHTGIAGRRHDREDIVDGLEKAPAAWLGLLEGRNVGKVIVRVDASRHDGVAWRRHTGGRRPLEGWWDVGRMSERLEPF